MKFTKMHGIGNDYVYVNCFTEKVDNPEQLAVRVSDRHKGIGSDGLILIMPSATCDFRMRMFNADGSEGKMCGNGSRCVGKFVYDKRLTDKTTITLETLGGVKILDLFPVNGKVEKVRVDMGEPILETAKIPVLWNENTLIGKPLPFPPTQHSTLNTPHSIFNSPVTCVSMGNPHAVLFTKDIDQLELDKIGPVFENFHLFPDRINTEFVEILSPNHARMRVWERGSGETMACGTGACAVEVAGVLNGLLERKSTISLLGGDLEIEWSESHVYMTGEAVTVFEGEIDL